jgi:hypothetical protein
MSFGGFLGFGSRLIAVPVDAMVLLGQDTGGRRFHTAAAPRFPHLHGRRNDPSPCGDHREDRPRQALSLTGAEQDQAVEHVLHQPCQSPPWDQRLGVSRLARTSVTG